VPSVYGITVTILAAGRRPGLFRQSGYRSPGVLHLRRSLGAPTGPTTCI
jgi:hypothetical protein